EERVALEDITDAPLLRRQVDPRGSVEEHALAHHDPPRIRTDQSREALEGQRLPGARGAEEPDDGRLGAPAHVEREARVSLDQLDRDHQWRSRASRLKPKSSTATAATAISASAFASSICA